MAAGVSLRLAAALVRGARTGILWPAIRSATAVAIGTGGKIPQIVVVDEVVGQWITLAGATRLNPISFLWALILFRAFDIWKPPPIRRIEQLPAGTASCWTMRWRASMARLSYMCWDD